ncbi:MAG: hypothetical protein WBN66_03665 [Smithella sp.]
MEAIKAYVKDNLPELAAEVVDWKRYGILHNGVGGKVRELARMISEQVHHGMDGLKIAETMINRAALEFVVRHREGNKTTI